MQEIFCPINAFTLKQKIYKIDTATGEKELISLCDLVKLPEILETIMQEQQIYTLHLNGDENFITEISEKIETDFNLKYSVNNLVIKYN